jgi:hypothetical protein
MTTTTTTLLKLSPTTITITRSQAYLTILLASFFGGLSTYAILAALGFAPLYFGPELRAWHKSNWGADAIAFIDTCLRDGYRLYRALESTRNFLTPGGVALPDGIRRVLLFSREKLTLKGVVYFGARCEGAPRITHGGALAAFIDAALGVAAYRTARMPCLTAQLIINYRKKVELGQELGIECNHVFTQGRKSKFQFRLFSLQHQDVVHCDGEATFINAFFPSRKTGLPPFLPLR